MFLTEEIKSIIKKGNNTEYRKFGVTIGSFLILISIILFYFHKNGFIYLLSIGVVLLTVAFIEPNFLKWLYNLWMSFAVILSSLMTRLILILLFFLLFIPMGLFIRIIKKDLLDEKYSGKVHTYWIKRTGNINDRELIENQF